MDFPNDVSTNVYKIDDLEEIYWAFYSRRHGKDEEGRIAHDEKPDEEEKDVRGSVQIIEYSLRKQGYHVLLDEEKPGLWVFCRSEAEMEGIGQLQDPDEFACLGSGLAHSSEFSSAPGASRNAIHISNSPSRLGSSIGEMNNQKYHANVKIDPRPLVTGPDHSKTNLASISQDYTLPNIYSKLLAAISHSMSHILSQTSGVLLVGSCMCVDVRTLGDHAYEYPELGLGTGGTATVSCIVRWHSSGKLLFALSGNTLARLSTLAYIFSGSQSSSKISLGESVLLSPSGVIGYFHGIENTPESHPFYCTRAEMKSSISSDLMSRGIWLPAKPQWVLVMVEADTNERESSGKTPRKSRCMKLWPAHLCLCRDVQNRVGKLGISALPESTMASTGDPLEEAQEWFNQKPARMEALKAKRLQDLAEAERTKEAADVTDEDNISDSESQIGREVTPRDISGIYPTPPDGLLSTVHESSLNNEPHSVGNADGACGGTTSIGVHQSYDEQRKDDLFEEMDIDLFATNGLTEDDFSFFDEPSLKEYEQESAAATFPSDSITFEEPAMAPISKSPFDKHPGPTLEVPDDVQSLFPLGVINATEISDGFDIENVENIDKEDISAETVLLNDRYERSHETTSNRELVANCSAIELESLLPKSPQAQKVSFDLVPFSSTSLSFDSKYASHGRYAFNLHDLSKEFNHLDKMPHEKYVPRFDVLETDGSPLEGSMDIGESTHRYPPFQGMINITRADDTDDESFVGPLDAFQVYEEEDEDDEEEGNEERSLEESHQHYSLEEKRCSSATPDLPATPLSSTFLAEDQVKIIENHNTMDFPTDLYSSKVIRQNNVDLKFGLHGDVHDTAVYVGNDRSFIQVAQMVAHQAVSGLDTLRVSSLCSPQIQSLGMTGMRRKFEEVLASVSSKWGKITKQCTLKEYVELNDYDAINVSWDQYPSQQKPPRPLYPRRASPMMGQAVVKLHAPHTCVQRTGTPIDIAATALRFWEELSLAPFYGPKNVVAICVCPFESVQDQVLTFLKMMEGAYQSCNLGLHYLVDIEQNDGLFQAPMGKSGLEGSSPAFYSACEDVGRTLGRLNLRGGNTVIYMADPLSGGQRLPTLCTGFLKLFDAYLATTKRKNIDRPNDLVLQIAPSDLMYSAQALPMPSPSDYRRLAFEVYDRCGPSDNGQQRQISPYVSAPLIRLAKVVPKSIDFRLTPTNSALSLQSDNCLHIAYAWRPGEDWLTASWTDNLGLLSWNSCYCLEGNMENPWPMISDIVNEIWETTLDMLQPRGGPWHLFICKSGAVLMKELAIWQSVFEEVNNASIKSSIRSSLFTLDLTPMLDFPLQFLEVGELDIAATSLATPDNTPQANTPSPDISGLGSTPGGATQISTSQPNTAFGDHDGDARLIDIVDQTWGVVTKTRVDDLCTASDHCPALACGYLVKRAGPRDEDGLVRMGVNVVHGKTPQRPLLKAMLGWYRNLGLLARVRGIVDPVKSLVPYHVAATNKAHAAVTASMRYGDGNR